MDKRTIYTILGMLLAVVFVTSGWLYTNKMLLMNEQRILLETGSRKFSKEPPPPPSSTTAPDLNRESVNFAEMYIILNAWKEKDNIKPHEPTSEQLTMDQAVAAGKAWLSYLWNERCIPELSAQNKINAFLCENNSDYASLVTSIPNSFDRVRSADILEPYYSYWTVRFTDKTMDATLIINAVNGQIWHAEIEFMQLSSYHTAEVKRVLAVYTDYLKFNKETSIVLNEQGAKQQFADGYIIAVAQKNTIPNKNEMYERLTLFLTTNE